MGYSIVDFLREFPDDDACLEYLFKTHCQQQCECGGKFYRIKKRKAYSCSCGKQIYPTKGTILEHTHIPLFKWFYAFFLFSKSKHGVAATELQRQLGVSYNTAFRMSKKIRFMVKEDNELFGIVEMDECYFRRGLTKDWRVIQTPVVAMVKREGKVKAVVTQNTRIEALKELARKTIKKGSIVVTDQYKPYNRALSTYFHSTINHQEEYARGWVNTNTVEGYFSHLKRMIRGTYHGVSDAYLQTYVDLVSFSWNHRHEDSFPVLLDRLSGAAKS